MADLSEARGYLLSSAACELLAATIGIPPGSVGVQRLHARPGIDVSVVYHCSVPGRDFHAVITTAGIGPQYLMTPAGMFSWWLHPDDPRLPALADACSLPVVSAWLGAPVVSLEILTYRPLRRAVLRAKTDSQTYFMKVLPPTRARGLIQRHAMLGDLAPSVVGTPVPGIVITGAAMGCSLANSYVAWHDDPAALPPPESLSRLLDRFPADLATLHPRPEWNDRIDFYLSGAAKELPELEPRILAIGHELRALLADTDRGPVVPSHGDFYEANIFVTGASAITVIDIDNTGPGHRVDDYACLLGHLAVLPDLSPVHYRRLNLVLADWVDHFSAEVDPIALRARMAGVIISLMMGASYERAHRRIILAEQWLKNALLLYRLR